MSVHPIDHIWVNLSELPRRIYRCGHCGATTGSVQGYQMKRFPEGMIYMCGGCNQPTYFFLQTQVPSPILGNLIEKLPTEIDQLYNEARRCTSLTAYTACVLCCRKILMHIAVDKGAEEGLSFFKYVGYLDNNHYIPPNGKAWVDHVRTKGNEANHEIVIISEDEARKLLVFVEMLLKFIYEFPELLNPTTP